MGNKRTKDISFAWNLEHKYTVKMFNISNQNVNITKWLVMYNNTNTSTVKTEKSIRWTFYFLFRNYRETKRMDWIDVVFVSVDTNVNREIIVKRKHNLF